MDKKKIKESFNSGNKIDTSKLVKSGAISFNENTGDNINNIEKASTFLNSLTGNGKNDNDLSTSIKIKDILPGGKDNQPVWQGISLNSLSNLGDLKSGLLSTGLSAVGLKSIGGILNIGTTSDELKTNPNAVGLEQTYNGQMSLLTPTLLETMDSPGIDTLTFLYNKEYIQKNLTHIGGLTPKGLNNAVNIQVKGKTLTDSEKGLFSKLGTVSNNLFPTAKPTADNVSLTWGQSVKNAILNPTFIGTAAVQLATTLPGVNNLLGKVQGAASSGGGMMESLGLTQEDILNIDSRQEAYVLGLKALYNQMSEEDKGLLSLYKYYRANVEARRNSPAGTNQFNLGQELTDGFFGSINYNVTSFVDGASDYISETWQNVSFAGAGWVRDQFEGFDGFSKALENATGIKLTLSDEFKEKVYDGMEKLGFGNLGIGTDTKAYINNTLLQRTYVKIHCKGEVVNVEHTSVISYFERYEYRNKLTTIRKLKVRLNNAQLALLDLNDPDLKISVIRRYGFALGQSPTGTYPPDYNTEMTEVERDSINEWPAKVVGNKTSGTKEELSKKDHKRTTSSSEPLDAKKMLITQDVEFILTPPLLVGNHTDQTINGIAEGENTISEIIDMAFQTCYEKGVLCPAIPKNNFVLKDFPIPPTNFEGLLTMLQKEYDIYEGGWVLYHDRLVVNQEPEDVYFLLPKRGPVELEFDEGWTVEIRVRYMDTPESPDMLCFIEPSRKKIIWPITPTDISTPGNSTELQKSGVTRYSKGSVVGAQQPADNKAVSQEVVQTNSEYLTPKKQENKKYNIIYVKMNNTFITFSPGDMVTLKWEGETYKGNVKEWAAQYVQGQRVVLLVLIMEEDLTKQTWMDKLSPGNYIEKMQEKVAGFNAKFTNKMNQYADKYGNMVQDKIDKFYDWESSKTVGGKTAYEWLNAVDPNIVIPTFNQEANHADTDVEYLQKMYEAEYDDPFQSAIPTANNGKPVSNAVLNNILLDPTYVKTTI